MFIEYNANPFKANIGDCMIRSISLALDMNYMDVFDGLIKIVDERGWELDEMRTGMQFLLDHDWEYVEPINKITVSKLSKEIKSPMVAICKGHATYLDGNGNILDTWNPGRYKVKYGFMKRIDE